VVVVPMRDQDEVRRRGVLGNPVRVYVDERSSDGDAEARVAEPFD
jgi:hypothetical protein